MPSPSLPFAAVALSGVGPYGGDLTAPVRMPERRNARFNGGVDVNGAPGLHRFEKATDVVKMGLKNEQPWHRMAAYMLLAGRTNSEIAMAANVHSPEVSTLRAQRWFQDLMATLANEAGADIAGLLSSEAQNSLNMMVDIRDDPNAPARLRYSAAKDLLELAHGKAVQRVVSVSHVSHSSPDDEMAEIQAELANLRR